MATTTMSRTKIAPTGRHKSMKSTPSGRSSKTTRRIPKSSARVAKSAAPKRKTQTAAPRKAVSVKKTKAPVRKAKPVKVVKATVKPKKVVQVRPVKKATPPPKPPTKTSVRPTAASRAAAPAPQPPKIVSKVKLLPQEFVVKLARSIKEAVFPAINAVRSRETVGHANSGDVTFHIDKIAEKALLAFLKDAKMPVAYYSEDSGYTTFASGQPQHLLVVDPIDGTRAAKSGFEWCAVSVACTRVIERPSVGDVDTGCVMEILGNKTFYAERGRGAKIYTEGAPKKAKMSHNADLETIVWAMTVPGRPAELIFPTAAKLIDLSSLKGGFFACNSTSYSLTRLLTNQLDACVDFANRYLRDIPEAVTDHFINAGRGSAMGIAPYDMAAALLIAHEAGCVVTDAFNEKLDHVLLLDSSPSNHRSIIAAGNQELHAKLMSFFDTRIRQYEQLLKRRVSG